MRKLVIAILALLVFPSLVFGDRITFKTGDTKEGIIEEETPTMVRLRVKDITIGVARSRIESIKYATREENDALKAKWEEKERELAEERQERLRKKEEYERTQRARGLKKVDGRWISPADARARRPTAAPTGAEPTEATEEVNPEEFSEYFLGLPEELKAAFRTDRSKIHVTGEKWETAGEDLTTLTAEVKNMGNSNAETILLVVRCFDEADAVVYSGEEAVDDLGKGMATMLDTVLPVSADLIQRVNIYVVGASWEE